MGVQGGAHENHPQVAPLRHQVFQYQQQEVAERAKERETVRKTPFSRSGASGSSPLLRSLVHFVHDDVRDAAELGIALQPPQQHPRGAVQKSGGGALKNTLLSRAASASSASEGSGKRGRTLTLSRRIW